jgi:hypothetical protein
MERLLKNLMIVLLVATLAFAIYSLATELIPTAPVEDTAVSASQQDTGVTIITPVDSWVVNPGVYYFTNTSSKVYDSYHVYRSAIVVNYTTLPEDAKMTGVQFATGGGGGGATPMNYNSTGVIQMEVIRYGGVSRWKIL